jgi:hypothetical protein
MRKRIAALAVGVALGSLTGADARAVQKTESASQLEIIGAWTLNHELTTKPDETSAAREAAGGGRGGFGGGFGGRGGGMGQPSEENRQRMQAVLRRLREAPERLTITSDGQTIAFADGDGRTWKVTTDGKKQTMLTGDGEIEIKARIEGPKLLVEETISGRGKLHYSYAPAEDAGTRRLSVQVKLEGGNSQRRSSEMTRVYDILQ